jgi:diaminopimelate epimerase
MRIIFTKYVGCGNDFILFDNRSQNIPVMSSATIATLCDRQKGVGADGILVLENSEIADYRMRIFNADGNEAEMCGNGIRCLTKFVHELEPLKSKFVIQTMQDTLDVSVMEEKVEINIPVPLFQEPIKLQIETEQLTMHFLDTGVPHVVIFVENVHSATFTSYAPKIRFHPKFAPRGANVNFVQLLSNNALSIRTYERGLERETLSCGTGATAAALVAANFYKFLSPIRVDTCSQESLEISFQFSEKGYEQIRMRGPAVKVFQGEIDLL